MRAIAVRSVSFAGLSARHRSERPAIPGGVAAGRLGTAALLAAALVGVPSTATASLIMEPVFNGVAGTGGGTDLLPFPFLDLVNGATGLPFITADEPGEIVTYPAGFPADPALADTVRFYNDTDYNITGFTLSIIGTADEPVPFTFTITRGPVDAIWGDANGDGLIGSSDIFGAIAVSADGKAITFSNGLIPIGGRFTDFIYSRTTAGETHFQAGVDARFQGVPVPEPATLTLTLTGAAMGLVRRRRTRAAAERSSAS